MCCFNDTFSLQNEGLQWQSCVCEICVGLYKSKNPLTAISKKRWHWTFSFGKEAEYNEREAHTAWRTSHLCWQYASYDVLGENFV